MTDPKHKQAHSQRIHLAILLLSFLVNLSFANPTLEQYKGKRIESIQLEGLQHSSPELILSYLSLQKGDNFDPDKSEKDFQTLNNLKLFKDIQIHASETEQNTLILTYKFHEYPKVVKIEIEGQYELTDKKIQKVMSLKEGSIYHPSSLARNQQSISDLYKSKGMHNSIITITVHESISTPGVNIKVQIQEGAEYYIEKLEIIGTKSLNPDRIAEIMQSRESYLLTNNTLNETKIREDQARIEQYMRNEGFFFGRVKKTYIHKGIAYPNDPRNKKPGYLIIVEVEEGDRYTMGAVTIQGPKIFKEEALARIIKPLQGQQYNDESFKLSLQAIQDKYYHIGYIQTKLIPTPQVREQEKILDWNIEVIEGDQVHIRDIYIQGHEATRMWVIDQELTIWEGELFQYGKIITSVQNLRNTQIFQTVLPNPKATEHDTLIDLIFDLQEQTTGSLIFTFGYGTVDGFYIGTELQKKNIFGTGWTAATQLQLGLRHISTQIGTSTEWLLPYIPITFDIRFGFVRSTQMSASYSLKEDFVNKYKDSVFTYRTHMFTLSPTIGYYVLDNLKVFTGYSVSFVRSDKPTNFTLDDISQSTRGDSLYRDLSAGIKGKYIKTISHPLGATYDTRDYTANPSSGVESSASFIYTGGLYSGDSHWLKFATSTAYYMNPVWKLVLSFYGSYETFFRQFDGRFTLRHLDKLRFDGTYELRGWRNLYTEGIVGSGSKISWSLEPRIPLFGDILSVVGFFDAGDVSDTIPSFPKTLRYFSAGFGFRLQVALLPIRIFFAKRMDYSITKAKTFTVHPGMEFVFTMGGYF